MERLWNLQNPLENLRLRFYLLWCLLIFWFWLLSQSSCFLRFENILCNIQLRFRRININLIQIDIFDTQFSILSTLKNTGQVLKIIWVNLHRVGPYKVRAFKSWFTTWRLLGQLGVVGRLARFSTRRILGHLGVVGQLARFSTWQTSLLGRMWHRHLAEKAVWRKVTPSAGVAKCRASPSRLVPKDSS